MTTTRRLMTMTVLAIAAMAGACDQVKTLIGQAEPTKAEPAKAEPGKAEPGKAEPIPSTATPAAPSSTAGTPAPAPAAAPVAAAAPTPEAVPTVAVAAAAPIPEAAAEPAVAADAPCIVGRWKAIEYLAEVRRAIAKDPSLKSMKRTSSGGLLGYQIDAPTDGKGIVSAKAESLRYVFAGKVEGFTVTLTFTLDGEAEASYTLVGDDKIVVAKPTKDSLKARASAKVEGIKYSKSPRVDHEFDGTFVYACDGDKLQVWRNAKGGEPMDFVREKS